MKRLTHVDAMKAIGIVLVVVGHSPGLNPFVKNVIYSFHMPLFFFISGLLVSEQKLTLTSTEYLSSLWKGLGIPYLFFFLISYLYWLPTHGLSASAARHAGISWWEPMMGVAIGNGDALIVNVALWFFTCLFTTSLIFFWARKHFSATSLLIAFNLTGFVFTLVYDPAWQRLPWGLDNAVVALAFYSTGHFFRRYQDAILDKTPKSMAMMLALFMLAGVAYVAGVNGEVDLNTLLFGSRRYLFLINAYLGVLALFYLSISLPPNAVFQWLSKNTVIIFPIHLLMFSIFTGVGVVVFGMPHAFKESSFLWTGLFALLALLLSYPSALFLHRFFPHVFGKRSMGIDSGRNQATLRQMSPPGQVNEAQAHPTRFAAPGSCSMRCLTVRPISTIQVGGFAVLKTTAAELATHLLAQRQLRKQVALFFANTNFVVQCRGMRVQMESEGVVIVNDGVGIDIAARLLHAERFRENLNGTDFIPFLFRQASAPLKVFMVGGKPRVLRKAAQYVTQQLGQVVVGTCDGYEGIKANPHLVETINRTQADVVLVAMGNPVQEKWILDHRRDLQAGILTGVGALFDFWAGDKPRAPLIVQKMRLEWFYRLCLEPRRLACRYTVDIVKFLKHCYQHRLDNGNRRF